MAHGQAFLSHPDGMDVTMHKRHPRQAESNFQLATHHSLPEPLRIHASTRVKKYHYYHINDIID